MVYGIIAAVFLLFFAVSAAGGYYMYRYAVVRRKNATDYWAHPEKVKPPQDMTAERAEIVVRGRKFLLDYRSEEHTSELQTLPNIGFRRLH